MTFRVVFVWEYATRLAVYHLRVKSIDSQSARDTHRQDDSVILVLHGLIKRHVWQQLDAAATLDSLCRVQAGNCGGYFSSTQNISRYDLRSN